MHPILARLGPFFIYSYTVVMIAAVGAALTLAFAMDNGRKNPRRNWLDGLLLAFTAALIGGRIAFVWANWSYYQENPGEIGRLWEGGLSYHGAFIAGILAFILWSVMTKKPLVYNLALLAPALALASAIGWAACWLDGCAFGREALPGLLTADLPDNFGVFAVRYRTQLIGVITSCIVFLAALILWRRAKLAFLPWVTLLLLSSSRLAITLMRGDIVPRMGSIRADSVADVALIVACLIILLLLIAAARIADFPKRRAS